MSDWNTVPDQKIRRGFKGQLLPEVATSSSGSQGERNRGRKAEARDIGEKRAVNSSLAYVTNTSSESSEIDARKNPDQERKDAVPDSSEGPPNEDDPDRSDSPDHVLRSGRMKSHRLRLRINTRERRRMHDLNSALDALRAVMPYAYGPSVRRMSKIATLLLAKNYILTLTSSLQEMRKLVYGARGRPHDANRGNEGGDSGTAADAAEGGTNPVYATPGLFSKGPVDVRAQDSHSPEVDVEMRFRHELERFRSSRGLYASGFFPSTLGAEFGAKSGRPSDVIVPEMTSQLLF